MSERTQLLVICLGSLLAGALVGLLTTTIHQAVWYIGRFPVPWGIVLALLLSVFFLLGLRLRYESRWPVIAAAISFMVTCGLALLPAPNGTVIVVGNLWGNIWALAPGLISVVIISWPRFTRKTAVDA